MLLRNILPPISGVNNFSLHIPAANTFRDKELLFMYSSETLTYLRNTTSQKTVIINVSLLMPEEAVHRISAHFQKDGTS
jgi:hypothetical protein